MRNVGRCAKCNRFLIAENESDHDCFPAFKGVKEIPVLYWFETEETGMIIAKAWNGILYRLVKTLSPSDDNYHPKRSDEDLTEPKTESNKSIRAG